MELAMPVEIRVVLPTTEIRVVLSTAVLEAQIMKVG